MKEFFKNLFERSEPASKPLETLAKLLSENNPNVLAEVQKFELSPQAYFDALDEDLKEDCFLESPSDISNTDVLVRSLYESGLLAVADGREEPLSVLNKLNLRSKGVLETSEFYEPLKEFYSQTEFAFGSLVGGSGSIEHSSNIFACARAVELAILAIDDGSDSLILIVCQADQRQNVSSLAAQAGIRLYFENM